ncbi:hypothetical protein RA086_07580 [Lactiplantibacillus sp. WILCCON 0030]|uniref:Cell surface protein n=1 Tax=Lactiplantibacillus brownii TaxID=3069269 RepID=A0ABU1AAR9_9LACO|nr:hypothetical protein [Lactiplantibacillus brownii]MDQ7937488.1 hypothetical protein [Lactiplantibacillus brownii]
MKNWLASGVLIGLVSGAGFSAINGQAADIGVKVETSGQIHQSGSTNDIAYWQTRVKSTRTSVDQLKSRIVVLSETITSNQLQARAGESEINAAEQQLLQATESYANGKAQIAQGETKLAQAKDSLVQSNVEVTQKQSDFELAQANNQTIQPQLATVSAKIADYQVQLSKLEPTSANYQQNQQELTQAKTTYQELAESAQAAKVIYLAKQQALADAQTKDLQLQYEYNNAKAMIDQGATRLANGKTQLDAGWTTVNRAKGQLVQAQAKLTQQEAQLNELKGTLTGVTNEMNTATTNLAVVKQIGLTQVTQRVTSQSKSTSSQSDRHDSKPKLNVISIGKSTTQSRTAEIVSKPNTTPLTNGVKKVNAAIIIKKSVNTKVKSTLIKQLPVKLAQSSLNNSVRKQQQLPKTSEKSQQALNWLGILLLNLTIFTGVITRHQLN